MKRVTIVGGTAGIGLATTQAALAAGNWVRAFSRNADKLAPDGADLERFTGDALVPADVQRAVQDVDAVILALGVPFNLRMLTGPITLFSEATGVVLAAMASAGVERLIAVTGFGAGECAKAISPLQKLPFNLVFGRAYADKTVQEDLIRASATRWTIARPGVLTNGSLSGYEVLVEPAAWRNGVISRASVADFLVQQLHSDALVGEAPVLVR
ncbi:MAG: NAD(P)H-binding protein [Pseudomonadota bacterium]